MSLALTFFLSFAVVPAPYFQITVVDEATGRGVPLVELRTVNDVVHFTDSNGVVAFHEPGLIDKDVFFHVSSHGYEFPKDGFGFRGKALRVVAGGEAKLKIRRLNIAERLYRVTGAGIHRDSVLTGKLPPIKEPVLNGQVFGSDSVVNAIHLGKIHWFWGDTNRPGYPLGNFQVPGATSLLPGRGGLDPEIGVDLDYFVDAKGNWKDDTYIPAYARQYPFVFVERPEEKQLTLCIDEGAEHYTASAKDQKTARLFDKDGKPTQFTNTALEFCGTMQKNHLFTQQFCKTLQDLNLVMPQQMEGKLESGRSVRMGGFQSIDQQKLYALPDAKIMELYKSGYLALIYFALLSMGNWPRIARMIKK